jgi:hypothetical protein
MPSVESASALLTAVSIGIAALSLLANGARREAIRPSEPRSTSRGGHLLERLAIPIVGMITLGFALSLYYLYLAEFDEPLFPLFEIPIGLAPRTVFILASFCTFFGIYVSLIILIRTSFRDTF